MGLDTNILIYLLENIEPYASKVEELLYSFMRRESKGVISTINVAEILTGFYLSGDEDGAETTKSLLKDLTKNGFEIAPVTMEIVDVAARLRAERGGKLPDALIVATSINQEAKCIYSQNEDLRRYSEDITIMKLEETS